jgi:hypothetical protein
MHALPVNFTVVNFRFHSVGLRASVQYYIMDAFFPLIKYYIMEVLSGSVNKELEALTKTGDSVMQTTVF